jgi:ribosomal protein S18 acetylase RimI-like enzyme
MSLRDLRLPADLEIVGKLLADSFQYPENALWSIQQDEQKAVSGMLKNLRRMWPLVSVIQLASPALGDIIRGFVWEEDARPVGVVLSQRRGTTDNWFVSALGVLPAYRRRGIARRLMMAAINMIQDLDGRLIFLDVIDGNSPAYQLYEEIGFEHYSGSVELYIEPGFENGTAGSLDGYAVAPLDFFDWRIRHDLEAQIAPQRVQAYEPVEEGRFRQPALMRLLLPLINFAQGMRTSMLLLRRQEDGRLIGTGRYDLRIRPGGAHQISARLDPSYQAAAPVLLCQLLDRVQSHRSERRINLDVPRWQRPLLDAAYATGFQKRLEYHRMGMMLSSRDQGRVDARRRTFESGARSNG